jgi:hypothetical protein
MTQDGDKTEQFQGDCKRGLGFTTKSGGMWKMLKKSLFEELTITIAKEDLARLLGAAEGFKIDAIQDEKTNVVFSLIRQTDFNEEFASPLEPGDLCEWGKKE